MLSRSSSDAGTRLRRSKSTSTVHRYQPAIHEPLDPRVAQHHAVTAAATAYARAHEHGISEQSKQHTAELSRSKSTSSRKSITMQGSHFPPRASSIRSTNRIDGSASIMHRQARASFQAMEKFPSFYPNPSIDGLLSTQPSITFNENTRPSSQPKSHRLSAASSITSQQIRKARSMYYASSVQTGSPIARPPAKYLTTPPVTLSPATETPPLPAPSPLVPRVVQRSPNVSPQLPVIVAPGETINLARDRYLNDFQQQRQVKHKPSLFLAPFKKRQDASKKKDRPLSAGFSSTRSGSRQTSGERRPEHQDDLRICKLKKEKRSFSNSIKDRLKKVFRRTSNNTTIMPVQQIEASREYFHYESYSADNQGKPADVPSPDNETVQRIRSRPVSIERMPSPVNRPESRGSSRSRGSARSLHSETHVSSRVTSWGDSSAGNTLTQRDIKRLTVIHESKDSISSDAKRSTSTTSLRKKAVPLPNFAPFKDPVPMESLVEETCTPLDPKRVFSALMREIDATKTCNTQPNISDSSPGAESDVFESSATKELHATSGRELHSSASKLCRASTSSENRPPSRCRPGTAQSKASSIRSFGKAFRSTIRAVTPSERKGLQTFEPVTRTTESEDLETINTAQCRNVSPELAENDVRESLFASAKQTQALGGTESSKVKTPSAEQVNMRMLRSKERWKTPLDEHQESLHYGSLARTVSISGTSDTSFHTPSTMIAIPTLPELEGDSPEVVIEESQTTPINHMFNTSPRPRAVISPLSPSIYSRNTDGISILPNDSVMSFEGPNSEDDAGSAVITASHAVKRHVIGTPSPHHRTDSTRSSRDWKAWLSREVSELGRSMEGDITIHNAYVPMFNTASQPGTVRRGDTPTEFDEGALGAETSVVIDTSSIGHAVGSISIESKESIHRSLSATQQPWSDLAKITEEKESGLTSTLPTSAPSSQTGSSRAVRKEGSCSRHSNRSAHSRSPVGTPETSMMNDRFPFIVTGRRSSNNSARLSRSSRSATDSGSSTRSKGTPSSKVYSDLSIPVTVNWIPQLTPRAKRENIDDLNNKENRKESMIQIHARSNRPTSAQSGSVLLSLPVSTETRPKSMLPTSSVATGRGTISSALGPTTSSAAEAPKTSSEHSSAQQISPSRIPQRQRMRNNAPSMSPKSLTTRPKSAFELRGRKTPPLTPIVSIHKATPGEDSLRNKKLMLYATSPSPNASMGLAERSRTMHKLHSKHSASTLIMRKQSIPHFEDFACDTSIHERPLSRRSDLTGSGSICGDDKSSMAGRITPGQRMAERFLRERNAPRGSGAGSPCSEAGCEYGRAGPTGARLEREDTPAFL